MVGGECGAEELELELKLLFERHQLVVWLIQLSDPRVQILDLLIFFSKSLLDGFILVLQYDKTGLMDGESISMQPSLSSEANQTKTKHKNSVHQASDGYSYLPNIILTSG